MTRLVQEDAWVVQAREVEELSERRLFAAFVYANGGLRFVPEEALQLASDGRLELTYDAAENGVLVSARLRP
jgi:hypothetical protein